VTPERYQQVKSAFRLTLEYPADQRESLLCQLCAGDPSLIPQVLALLSSDSIPQTAIDKPAVGAQFRLRSVSLSYTATRH
jgi:hypothetical protein